MSQDDEIQREERAIYALAILTLAPVVIVGLVEGVELGGGETLCLLAVVLGLVGLVASIWQGIWQVRRRAKLPLARTRARSRARAP